MKKIFFILALLCSSVFATDLDTKIGQMILVGFNGDDVNSPQFQKVLDKSKYYINPTLEIKYIW